MSQPLSWADQAISLHPPPSPPFLTGNLSESQISQRRRVWNTPRAQGAHTDPRLKGHGTGRKLCNAAGKLWFSTFFIRKKKTNQNEWTRVRSAQIIVGEASGSPSKKEIRKEKKKKRGKSRILAIVPWTRPHVACIHLKWRSMTNATYSPDLTNRPSKWRPECSAITRRPSRSWCVSSSCLSVCLSVGPLPLRGLTVARVHTPPGCRRTLSRAEQTRCLRNRGVWKNRS